MATRRSANAGLLAENIPFTPTLPGAGLWLLLNQIVAPVPRLMTPHAWRPRATMPNQLDKCRQQKVATSGEASGRLTGMAVIGTLLEHIAGALWTSADFYGLAVPARPSLLQGHRGIQKTDVLNS